MKLTDEKVNQICTLLKTGVTRGDACTRSGIDRTTLWRAMQPQKDAEGIPLKDEDGDPIKSNVCNMVELAEAEYIGKMTDVLNAKSVSEPTGKRALEVLERRRPEEWGEVKKVEHTGTLDVSVKTLEQIIDDLLLEDDGQKDTENKSLN